MQQIVEQGASASDIPAGDLEQLALLAANDGRLTEADSGLRSALSKLRVTVASDHWRIDNTLRNLGLVLIAQGRLVDGLGLLDSARNRARRRDGGVDSQGYGYMTGQRVLPLLRLGRIDEALDAAQLCPRGFRSLVAGQRLA